MPALVIAALILQDWKTKTPGWESIDTVRIAGVGIGWKPWQVIDVLGQAKIKTGDMAGDSTALAMFNDWVVGFENGSVVFVRGSKTHSLTNILSFDSLPKDIEKLYGKPGIVRTRPNEKYKWTIWEYPNGVSYSFQNGLLSLLEVSKETWDKFQKPDWGIEVEETKGSSSFDTKTGEVLETKVKGILRNNRNTSVRVVLRVRWSYKSSDKLADVYDSSPYRVGAHDTTIFAESGGRVTGDRDNLVYEVTVKSVEEL